MAAFATTNKGLNLRRHRADRLLMPGTLYYGDNLEVLRYKLATESVDLIYLDPPFSSNRTYNLTHKQSQAQQNAFFDTWNWDDAAEHAFAELTGDAPSTVRVPERLTEIMVALRKFFGREHSGTTAYLSMMAIRLVEMHRVLRASGSIFLHCDPTASHYLKLILDAIFDVSAFRSEIIWRRTGNHNAPTGLAAIHDTIFWFTK